MDRPDWDELVAQVEDNGCGPLEFYLSGATADGSDMLLNILSIRYEDDQIKVILE